MKDTKSKGGANNKGTSGPIPQHKALAMGKPVNQAPSKNTKTPK